MSNFFTELKRRNVVRVAVAYLVISWLVLQVANILAPILDLSPSFSKYIFLFLLLGFIPTVLFSWAFELTPEGIKKEKDVERDDSITKITAKKLDYVTIAAAVGVAGLFGWQQMNPSVNVFSSTSVIPATTSVIPVATGSQNSESKEMVSQLRGNDVGALTETNSIAVLPFVNMSSDKEQEYFADGISEEILNALVKATGLRVAGRTSSFSFKGKDDTIKQIGDALNVAHVLEGSVRKQGNQVRITAQLIKSDDEFHMWSETYDGDLDNIFDLQENISRQVTDELKVILDLNAGERLANKMTDDIEAYDLFLRGREHVEKRLDENIPKGINLLKQAVERDPKFAEAWAVLAEAEAVSIGYVEVDAIESEQRSRVYAKKAIALNSKLALPFAVLGLLKSDQGEILKSIADLEQALSLEPNNPVVNRWLGLMYARLNRNDLAFPYIEKSYRLDPLSSINSYNLASHYFLVDDYETALKMFRISGDIREDIMLESSFIYELQGKHQQAKDNFNNAYDRLVEKLGADDFFTKDEMTILSQGTFNATEQDKKSARALKGILIKDSDDTFYWQLAHLIAIEGIDRVYEILEENPSFFSNLSADIVWYPNQGFKKFRADPRFIKLLQKHNFPQAWQEIGWPKSCKPFAGTDGSDGQFSCE